MSDDERINDAEVAMNRDLMKLVEQYASCDERSKEINDERAELRETADKLGVGAKALMRFVADFKHYTPGELADIKRGYQRMVEAAGDTDVQQQFWPEQAEAARKREERKAKEADEAAVAEAAKGPDTDTNPRSDPNSGGAKPQVDNEAEQAEGDNVLQMGPRSQSAQAEAKRSKAGIN